MSGMFRPRRERGRGNGLFVVVVAGGEGVAVPVVVGIGQEDEAAGFALADEPAAGDGGAVEFRRVFVVAAFQFA